MTRNRMVEGPVRSFLVRVRRPTNGRWKTSLRRVYSIDDWRLEEMSLDDGIVVAPLESSGLLLSLR